MTPLLAQISPFLPEIVLGLLAVVCLSVAWIIHLEIRIRRMTRGATGGSLEDAMNIIDRDLRALSQFQKDMEEYLTGVETRVRKSVQGVGTIRFNAFEGTGEGGQQSFATAFLNEEGDGVVVSSIRARDRVGIYAKPIAKYVSDYELTEEERGAIAKARAR